MFEFWPIAALLGLLVVGVILVVWADRWRKRPSELDDDSLDQYRDMFHRGMLTDTEFEQIQRRFANPSEAPDAGLTESKNPPQPEDSPEEN